ncbi:radical SAM protein [Salinibius halmophilus]|uniref:radical SAM protein n=1 Tax=Salinibius halmophilus TaxID=1853216 RepID=UPI000E668234|nr:radical SAM protein [Salinibius halmophilus]
MSNVFELPKFVTLYTTLKCQLSCSHCYFVQSGLLNKQEMEWPQIKKTITELRKGGVFGVGLAGGDPLLHKDFVETIRLIKNLGMMPLVATTGVGLTEEYAVLLKNSGLKALRI